MKPTEEGSTKKAGDQKEWNTRQAGDVNSREGDEVCR